MPVFEKAKAKEVVQAVKERATTSRYDPRTLLLEAQEEAGLKSSS